MFISGDVLKSRRNAADLELLFGEEGLCAAVVSVPAEIVDRL